jgi:LPS-assembly protein
MNLVCLLSGGHRSRLPAAFIFFLALIPCLRAQQDPPSSNPKGSGKLATVRADSQQKDKDVYHFRGHVQLVYDQVHVTADEASIDYTSGDVIARGHVIFDDPTSHLAADEVHYNFRTQKGWFSNGVGYVHAKGPPRPRVLKTQNPFYISGETVDRLDENTYTVNHGSMTTCDCAKDGWLISAGRARVTPGDKMVAHNAVFRFLGVPIFYFPVLADSLAREPRHTGFLLPHIGNSTQKGYIFGDGFFWAINPSADLMLGAEENSKRGIAERGEFRAKPSENADFTINYFGINDRYSAVTLQQVPGTNTYVKVPLRAPGESIRAYGQDNDIGDGFRAVANVDYVNTMAFRLTWSPNYAEAVSSEAVQSGFVTKNWNTYSFNVYAERYQDFLSTNPTLSVLNNTGVIGPTPNVIIRHLPSIEFAGGDHQIGNSPAYYSFESSADMLGRTEVGTQSGLAIPLLSDRLDIHPQILLRPGEFWHFRFTPAAGFRVTHYGTSLDGKHTPVNRVLGEVGFDLRPPSLEKIFANSYHGYRLKHVIEPDIQYHLVRESSPESILDVVRFDALDIFTQTNDVEYSLTNTVLARKDVPENSTDTPQARDVFSWRLSQKYYFDPTFGGALIPGQNNVLASTIDVTGFSFEHGQRFSPVDSVFKFAPFSNYDTEIRTDVNPSGKAGILDAGITSHIKRGLFGLSLTDFFINKSSYFNSMLGGSTTTITSTTSLSPLNAFHLLGALISYGDPNHRGFSGNFGIDYNFQQKEFQHAVSQVSYNFGCFALDIEYQDYYLLQYRRESQFRVALSLANVGTFGNLKPHELTAY